ncbi:hypothetical protein LPJ78_001588 [Coemansia sp. RSA 989]|nr:hypothetical protein LPJ79_001368 [Coemansia sp. RSA 1821]KAJ1866748.1 hypothetical protein LPJ78_001588 [Coemansia sp. RSA 989]KAJ1873605.1 hypothetical protein LPJ55_002173 [Coemansia sp. RSA 990]KAJ2648739.1 hypothetical protein IWW40_003682 [Coemansia sp. RSA 1250]
MQASSQPSDALANPRRRVKQLSSVKAWCQSNGMDMDLESDSELASYESFPDLRRLLEEECAEIERREHVAKATLEERMRRRNSDSLSDSSSSSSYRSTSDISGSGFIGSLYRLIDPIIPGLGTGAASGSASSSSPGTSTKSRYHA